MGRNSVLLFNPVHCLNNQLTVILLEKKKNGNEEDGENHKIQVPKYQVSKKRSLFYKAHTSIVCSFGE